MRKSDDDGTEPPGGRAAKRLEEFLKGRLPPGVSPEELNPGLAQEQKDEGGAQEEDRDAHKDDIGKDRK